MFKEDYENKFKVFLRVSPWIDNMAQLANAVSLTCNLTKLIPINYGVEQGLLTITYSYEEEILDEEVTVYLKPYTVSPTSPGIWSQLPPTNCTFTLGSDNGFELHVYSARQYQVAAIFHYIAMIMGYLILASAFLYILGRLKWMGNLLFLSLQFQYLSMVFIPRYNPMLAGLSQIKTVMGYN